MTKKHKKFLLKAQREQLLQQIEKGAFEVKESAPVQVTAPAPLRHQIVVQPPSKSLVGASETLVELKRIVVTAALLVMLVVGVRILQIYSPIIDQAGELLGRYLAI